MLRLLFILGICFGATFVAGAIGAWGSIEAREFYATLQQPGWAPPGWLFGPVWTSLYCLMATAASMVWLSNRVAAGWTPLIYFAVQLPFNAIWSWLFFVWRKGGLAFAEIMVLWVLVGATLIQFWKVRRMAAVLLIPYWAWVTFASLLCYTVWRMNPDLL